ncbi:sensor histidine kinase [Microbispora hainanensis]|uniref:histidine kinase n=1 Tax=Microbispora hainanensis TaxID=568844 RepID=A0A544Z4U5_9ACTN|nr:sensor histidine kinase [Microbispora hainanensis]TQS23652.1 sensor histidine kinase [Microbispora hainanensis]
MFLRAFFFRASYSPIALGVLAALLALAEAVAHARGATPLLFGHAATAPPLFEHGVTAPVSMAASTAGTPVDTGMGTMVMPVTGPGTDPGGASLRLVAFGLLALATTVPVVFLRTQPTAAALVVGAAGVLSFTAFRTLTVAGAVVVAVGLYRLGLIGARRLGLLLAAPYVVAALLGLPAWTLPRGVAMLVPAEGETRVLVLLLACIAPAAALAGVARRATGEAADSLAARQVIAGTLLEHTARGERARIARELHDVVAHHISMVAVQAETARVAVPGMPSAGAERLRAIGDTARAALTEMRRLLGVLREDDREGAADLRPQPGLRPAELNALLDEARDASGTAVRLVLSGSPAVLDPGVELAAHRIIQEALTNARRHAPGAAVDVELHYTRDALRLHVRDNGPGIPLSSGTATGTGGSDGLRGPGGAVMPVAAVPSEAVHLPGGMAGHELAGQQSAEHESAGHGFARHEWARHGSAGHGLAGHGLAGMRERAAAVGGELRIGSAAGGGFVVEACLPRLPDADDFQASGAPGGPDRWWGPAAPAGPAGGRP